MRRRSVCRIRACAYARCAKRIRIHGDSTIGKDAAIWAEHFGSFEHISLPVPWIAVDTTDGYDPPLEQIVAFVSAA